MLPTNKQFTFLCKARFLLFKSCFEKLANAVIKLSKLLLLTFANEQKIICGILSMFDSFLN